VNRQHDRIEVALEETAAIRSPLFDAIPHRQCSRSIHDGHPAFVRELKAWMRFNGADAARAGDGLFSRSTGNPAVPRWLGNMLLGTLLTPRSENKKCAAQLRSSAGVAVLVSAVNDRAHWIEQAAVMSASPCRRPRLADPIWWCDSAGGPRCRGRCVGRWNTFWSDPHARAAHLL
jgi:hypothetical protein